MKPSTLLSFAILTLSATPASADFDLTITPGSATEALIFNHFKNGMKVVRLNTSIEVINLSFDKTRGKSLYVKFQATQDTGDTLFCEAELLQDQPDSWKIGGSGCEI